MCRQFAESELLQLFRGNLVYPSIAVSDLPGQPSLLKLCFQLFDRIELYRSGARVAGVHAVDEARSFSRIRKKEAVVLGEQLKADAIIGHKHAPCLEASPVQEEERAPDPVIQTT